MTDDRERVADETAAPSGPPGAGFEHALPAAGEREPDDDPDRDRDDAEQWSSWANLWQVPAIVFSLVLIAGGLYVASDRRPDNDFDGVLEQVDQLIAVGEFAPAREALQRHIEPFLDQGTKRHRARYHATVADWVFASQRARGVSVTDNNRLIADQYALSVELGLMLSPTRVERWAHTLIDLGEAASARQRLAELEAIGVTDAAGDDARSRRNRVLRRLVEFSLVQDDLTPEAVLETLETYRSDSMLDVSDRVWVAIQQARVRLGAGDAASAVARILVDMRRLEQEEEVIDAADWGRLYTLLGKGYYDQGLYDQAEYHLQAAVERFQGAEPERAEPLLLVGRIEQARGDLEAAHQRFDEIVTDYAGTSTFLAGRLARAEVESILGRHEQSIADYEAVIERLATEPPRRDVTRRGIASSLADRHDAALTVGNLALALQYVDLAEGLFEFGQVPPDVLRRIASTSRQIADNITATLRTSPDGLVPLEEADPELRFMAAEKYRRAGDYFIRHARALAADADAVWAESLWLTGDSYDRAGLRQLAIRHFIEYVAGRSVDDPRRAEVTFRLAQCYQAEGEDEAAAATYARLIEEHPRSTFGTRSHVPLARSLRALGRGGDAEQQLLTVVEGRSAGQTPLTPEAADYRDALIALGRLYYDTGQYRAAIERLTLAVQRYGDDERIDELRFFLADSHRHHALDLRSQLRAQPMMPPQEQLSQQELIREQLAIARDEFARASDGYDARDERRLDRLEQDCRRYAAFYRADCAFELEQFELAAELYDQAARRYSDHHASMHALVQIVNCFDHLGRSRDADIAHQNALTRLRQLPDEAFEDPHALMDRAAWEQWLRNRPAGLARAQSGPATN